MMEILFRGKRIDTGEWVYGWVFGEKAKSIIEIDTQYVSKEGVEAYCTSVVIPKTVGQYTGFTDMNGVKIFVGDITEIEYGGWKVRREIVFSQGAFQYLNSGGLSPMPMRYMIKDFNTFYGVVIGNIHDNPGLLEGKE